MLKNLLPKLFFLLTCCAIQNSSAQNYAVSDSIHQSYKFIKTGINRLQGDTATLIPFFDKLKAAEQLKNQKIAVVHLGDSHLQADHYPGMLRMGMQQRFGNAGRGLVTPFKVGRTNEPNSYKSSSNVRWHSRRIVNEKDSLPIGISGLSIKNDDAMGSLMITALNQNNLNYSFSKITLFHQKGLNNYSFIVCDSLSCFQAGIDAQSDTLYEFSTVNIKPANCAIFTIDQKDTAGRKTALIYGMVLENEQPGILYHMIGINGAEYRHYNKHPKLQQQLSVLKPDLIIISLGTNEAYAPEYNNTDFIREVDSLISSLREKNPHIVFIITTPGDSNKSRKYKNPNNLKACNALIAYCEKQHLVYWNWFQIMGGTGVINKWAFKGLTSKDKLHLNRKGYEIQGALLLEAIMKSYHHYQSENSSNH
jgi:lysophospholipase L1-like esterase